MRRSSLIAGAAVAAALALSGCSASGDSGSGSSPSAASDAAAPGSGGSGSGVSAPVAAGVGTAAEFAQQPAGVAVAAVAPDGPTAVVTDRGSITAQGVGKVIGTPDVMTISLGVETRAASAKAALDQNNSIAAEVIEALKGSGVDPADLQTSQLSVNPTYGDNSEITGYQVTNSVTAVLRDIAGAGAVIDAVGQKAGNAARVQQLSFSIDDDSALRAAARADAVKQAQAQAKQLADAAGVKLGAVHSIVETAGSTPTPVYAAADSAAAGAPVPIEPGSQELSVVVQIVYDIAQ
jgi:hypothetical protein